MRLVFWKKYIVLLGCFGCLGLWTTVVYAQSSKTDQQSDSLLRFLTATPLRSVERGKALLSFAELNWRRANPEIIEQFAQEAFTIFEAENDTDGKTRAFLSLARSHQVRDNYLQALNYFLEALKIAEKTNDRKHIGAAYNGIGIIYSNQKEYDKALFFYYKYMNISKELDATDGQATCLNNIANIHKDLQQYDSALYYYQTAFRLIRKPTDKTANLNALLHNNIADNYLKAEMYDSALYYNLKAYELLNAIGNKRTLTTCLNNMGLIYLRKGDFEKSEQFLNEGLALSRQIGRKENIKNAYLYLAEFYEKKLNFDKALVVERMANVYKDSLLSEEKTKGLASLQLMYDLEKKQTEVQLLTQERKLDLLIRYGLLAFMILLGAMIYGIYRNREKTKRINEILMQKNQQINQRSEEIAIIAENLQIANEEIRKQKEVIELKNENVMASIQYAFRIQTAILPFRYRFDRAFGQDHFFVLYKPRDVVSGDFYFLETYQLHQGKPNEAEITILAVADCTGHGVPGAFMSMIGIQILTEIVAKNHIYEPDQMLNYLQREMRRTLKQNESGTQDGMDIGVLTLQRDSLTRLVKFAGAMNHLYYVHNQEFKEIKADKLAIGVKRTEPFSYQVHSLQFALDEKPIFYLCTDGFQDQFGGEKKRKFMSRRFKELLFTISEFGMAEQERILNQTLEDWQSKGDEKQTDDITVIGIKL